MRAGRLPRALVLSHESVQIVLCSQAGATHAQQGKPCQDACLAAQQFFKGTPYTLLAIADGHGGASYTRSEVGAHLAVHAVQSAATRFIPYVQELVDTQPAQWRRIAQHEFQAYFGKWVRHEWEQLVLRHWRRSSPQHARAQAGDVFAVYGTTLAVVLLWNNLAFAGAIGDSVIYYVQAGDTPRVFRAFPDDPTLVGTQTHSLSSPDAHYQWTAQTVSLKTLGMLVLATDGFSDSLVNPEAAVRDMYEKASARGLDWLTDVFPKELRRWSDEGVGDDISAIACLVTRQQPKPSVLRMFTNKFR